MKRTLCFALLGAALASSALLAFTAGPAAAQPPSSGSFLCYSVGGNPFYAPDQATAMAELQAGYWLPEAVPGNVPAGLGENVGPYHLDCFNAAVAGGFGNTAPATQYVDGTGNLLSSAYVTGSVTNGLGTYPVYGLPATQ